MHVSIGSVIIDDIVLPDGTTHMACLGGGGVHAAMGMRVWSEDVGLVANIGNDFPADIMRDLENAFDVRGLVELEIKTFRAWQLFEKDGTRREVFRSNLQDVEQLKSAINDFPDEYDHLEGVHLHTGSVEVPLWVPFLRQRGKPFIMWEPWQRDSVPENRGKLIDILPLVDCVSPNLEEARCLMEMKNIKDILNKYLEYGAKRVVIREGADGSTYADSEGNYIKVPAVKVEKIIDQTGAGNAYCAGLAVAFLISDTTDDALCRAAVSASFPLEQFGALFSLENIQEHARKRFLECRKKIFSQGE